MKRIIITADDYGMCHEVDDAIDNCMSIGMVTTTNVIVNMETAYDAKKLREQYPNISIGVHWNVTTGRPISSTEKIQSLVDNQGNFYTIEEFKKRMYNGKIDKSELEHELVEQYKIFQDLCRNADYWNTHENSALCVPAFYVYSKVAKQFGIPATRNFQRVYIDLDQVSFKRRVREFIISRIANIWFGFFIKRDFAMPDARLFPFDLKSKFNSDLLVQKLKNNKKNVIEVVVHPSITASHPLFGNIANDRVQEYEFINNEMTKKALLNNDMKLCNFDVCKKR